MLYILEFSTPMHHAKYYVGWTKNLGKCLEHHKKGQGASITRAVIKSGRKLNLVFAATVDRKIESRIKKQKNTPRLVEKIRAGKLPAYLLD